MPVSPAVSRRTSLRASLLALLAAAAFALPAAPAEAAPRLGAYACSNSYSFALGVLRFHRQMKYSVSGSRRGRYTFNRRNRIINFKTGAYGGRAFFGKYYPRRRTVDIYDFRSGDYLWTCAR